MQTEDGEIVYKCLNGKPEAFGFLVDKYRESIFSFAYSELHNFHDAEDITQEVFIKAYRKLNTLRHYDRFIAWLYSITSHLCKNLIRSRQNRPDHDYVEDQTPEDLMIPSMDSYREDIAIKTINEALDSLPKLYSQALTLHYLGGMSIKEIAVFLGTSINAIKHRLSRARMQLKGEVLGMMSETFSQQKLKAGFTFRIVEAIKHIRIQPAMPIKTVPWIISLATGVILGVLSLGSGIKLPDLMPAPVSLSLAGETKVLKVGEIPVDVIKIAETTNISNDMGKDKGGNSEQFNAQSFFMAPQGQGDTWTKRADMPTPRHGISACAVNGKIYVFGGAKDMGAGAFLSTVEEYDPAADRWIKKADMPTPRARLATCVANGKIYAIGGWPINGAVEEYDPATDKWTRKTPMIAPSERLAVSAVGEKIYTFGGWSGVEWRTIAAASEYDTVTDTWTKKADLPETSEYYSANTVNGKIYIIGWFHNVLEYDPISDKYTQKAAVPSKQEGNPNFWHDGASCWHLLLHSASVIHDKIYVIGGSQPNGNQVAVYDPIADKWEEKADMPTARCWLATGEVNGKIYAIGGANPDINVAEPGTGQPFSTVEEYDTGLGVGVDFKGKLPTKWGKLRVTTKEEPE
jgi:RNA polymerase sigma factor (sigma-70 family)